MRLTRKRSLAIAVAVLVAAQLLVIIDRANAGYGSGDLGTTWQYQPPTTTGAAAGADVLLVGDSITARCWPALRDQLRAKGHRLAVNYLSGRTTASGLDWLAAQHAVPPLVVLELGTNDIFDPSVIAQEAQRAYQSVPDSTTLMWADVYAVRTRQPATVQLADARNSAWVNTQIRGQVPAANVIPWSVAFAAKPSRIGMYLTDGVHPKPGVGCAFWAANMAGPINLWFARQRLYTPPGGPR